MENKKGRCAVKNIIAGILTNNKRKEVKKMKCNTWVRLVCLATIFMVAIAGNGYAQLVTAPTGFNASTMSGYLKINYTYAYDSSGHLTTQTGRQEFSSSDLDYAITNGFTDLTFQVTAGSARLAQSYTKSETTTKMLNGAAVSLTSADGNKTTTTQESTSKNTFDTAGLRTGGSVNNSSLEITTDKNNQGVGIQKTSSSSTNVEIRNGQLLVLATSGTSLTYDGKATVDASGNISGTPIRMSNTGDVTTTNVYGNYSGGQWNVTSATTVDKSHGLELQTGKSGTSLTDYQDYETLTMATTRGYDTFGTLTSQNSTGSASGRKKDTSDVYRQFANSSITATYGIFNGVARQTSYNRLDLFL
jgi:hypothetical protein